MPERLSSVEMETARDRVTGVNVTQLTDNLAHSYHLYFTNPGWWDGGKRLLFGSDRGNCSNLHSLELANGVITRITDNSPGEPHDDWQGVYINPTRDEAYVWRRGSLVAVDLRSGAIRTLLTPPENFGGGSASCTADGKYALSSLMKRPDVGPVDLGHGYVGFSEIFEAKPLCQLVRVPVDGGPPEVLVERNAWIGHVNPSPTQAHLLTFCYEGPWTRVGQRIWGLDTQTKEVWKIRPQVPGEAVGHEYWMSDGLRVGYHGKTVDGVGLFGHARFDDSERVEVPFPLDSHHFHSNTPDLIVADGPQKGLCPYVLLCRFNGERFEGPRVLCTHRSSRHTQHLHVHPCFTPDGTKVLFTADPRGYGNLFLADVPAFESLPTLEEVNRKRGRGEG